MSDAFADLGFDLVGRRRDGSSQYTLRANPYLRFWLVVAEGGAEITWELSLGEYLARKDLAVSAQDVLSLLVFPQTDVRGPADPSWVRGEVERVLGLLASVDLATGA